MKTVVISVSKGKNDHRFIINGETVYEGDAIANFVHKPFDEWKDEILPELYENCNDEFCIELSSGEDEFRYLDVKRKSFPKCVEIIWNGRKHNAESDNSFSKEVSANDVWDKLNEIYIRKGNRFKPTRRIKIGLYIAAEEMEDYADLIKSVNEAGFSSGGMSLKCPYFNFVIEEIEEYDIEGYEGLVFFVGDGVYKEGAVILDKPKEAGKLIRDILAAKYIMPFINDSLNDANIDETVIDTETYKASVNLTVDIPEKIDVGKSQLISIVGMPKAKALDMLKFEMSEAGILRYDRGRLFAVAPGTVEVRVKLKGKIEPVKRCMVEAVNHIFVTSICLSQDVFSGTVGDVYQIKPVFAPSNAENINDVKYESMNPRIAAVSTDGLVELYSTGKTKIRVSVGNVETYMPVSSELKITKIVVSSESLKMSEGESQDFYVHVEPACYNADNLKVSIDNEVVSYDKGIIRANAVGVANIVFKSPNSNCEAKAQITVISSNYVLARRALQTGNYSDASRLYEQIRIEYPDDWESNFFSVYAKAYKADAADIPRSMEVLQNSVDTTCQLIRELYSDNERVNAISIFLRACVQISEEMAQKASTEHSKARVGGEHLESRGVTSLSRHNCAALDYIAANTVEYYFMSTYPQIRDDLLDTWKTGVAIDAQTIQYASGQNKSILQSDITTVTQKIRQYDPSYNAPRPTGSDSTFFDYVSLIL